MGSEGRDYVYLLFLVAICSVLLRCKKVTLALICGEYVLSVLPVVVRMALLLDLWVLDSEGKEPSWDNLHATAVSSE